MTSGIGLVPTVVITMAGFGNRFRAVGFDQPKYMIEAGGATLFDWSMRGLNRFIASGSPFIFVVRAADRADGFIRRSADLAGIRNVQLVELDAPTDGQATTARIAADRAVLDRPFAIFNIDTAIKPDVLRPEQARGSGWLPCFRAPGDGWSFVRLGTDGWACEVREKSRISEFATVGFYWFETADLYKAAYDTYYKVAGREERGERYVAPLYNQIIEDGRPVSISVIDCGDVTPLGTPEELDHFLAKSAVQPPDV